MHTIEQIRSGALHGIKRLDLAEQLTEFPVEIFDLADSLEILNLSENLLCHLPTDLYRLKHLRILFCSSNRFEQFPRHLSLCPKLEMIGFKSNQIRSLPESALPPDLRWLILTDNALENLPQDLGQCTKLQKLMLAGNRLRSLPPSLAQCQALELLRISANQLEQLPNWILAHPTLAWLAFAGNPFCHRAEQRARATKPLQIPGCEFQRGELLGQGASGLISRAQWNSPTGNKAVALKKYKGQMTSDGLPELEKAAAHAAGKHPQLIPIFGEVENEGDLVLELLGADFSSLAGPPSLESCTRDVYAQSSKWELDIILNWALKTASVLAHLHARGIMHGDFYGHNLLINPQGDLILSDFGAASFFEPNSSAPKLEVRAWGILLYELLQRCTDQTNPTHKQFLTELADKCTQNQPGQRPNMSELLSAIQTHFEIGIET